MGHLCDASLPGRALSSNSYGFLRGRDGFLGPTRSDGRKSLAVWSGAMFAGRHRVMSCLVFFSFMLPTRCES